MQTAKASAYASPGKLKSKDPLLSACDITSLTVGRNKTAIVTATVTPAAKKWLALKSALRKHQSKSISRKNSHNGGGEVNSAKRLS